MELGSDTTFQEEREEVLASVRDAMRTGGRDPGLRAAAGFLLRHLTGAGQPEFQHSVVSHQSSVVSKPLAPHPPPVLTDN
jgi:hypothetical protein